MTPPSQLTKECAHKCSLLDPISK